jgi:uncharacterized surface protein with fasciclin (FAS1) repeats
LTALTRGLDILVLALYSEIAQTAHSGILDRRKKGKIMFKKSIVLALALMVFASANSAFAWGGKKKKDIVDTAVAAGNFKTLAAALTAAGLIDALKGPGPFTVFAPTDEAFAKLPAGTIEMLLKPENKEKLKAILLYHVVNGKVPAKEVVKLNGEMVETLQGGKVTISTTNGVMVNQSKVVTADIYAKNGIIHVIDTVLIPN